MCPAALYKALGGFATNSVNMTKLESYYESDSFTATEFYADIVGHEGMANVARAMEELRFSHQNGCGCLAPTQWSDPEVLG